MRTACLGTALALFAAASCSDDKDPITQKCETACKLDSNSPCASHQSECVKECRSVANQAESYGGTKCYQCVADSYQYVIVNGVCGGGGTVYFTHKAPLETECIGSCVKPDGAVTGF